MHPTLSATINREESCEHVRVHNEAHSSGVSWAAVAGGAFVAAAFSLMLVSLGSGFGLETASPWDNSGHGLASPGTLAVVWLLLSAIISSSLGGYLTGRLRTKWAVLHTDEVFFRDTANGLLSWAVSIVVKATVLASAATSLINRGGKPVFSATMSTTGAAGAEDPHSYLLDTLFRSSGSAERDAGPSEAVAGRILANGLVHNELSTTDRTYLLGLMAAYTGITPEAADRRISDAFANARQVRDSASEATAHFLFWVFLALAVGAFSASFAATLGGRQRDHVSVL